MGDVGRKATPVEGRQTSERTRWNVLSACLTIVMDVHLATSIFVRPSTKAQFLFPDVSSANPRRRNVSIRNFQKSINSCLLLPSRVSLWTPTTYSGYEVHSLTPLSLTISTKPPHHLCAKHVSPPLKTHQHISGWSIHAVQPFSNTPLRCAFWQSFQT